jgi:hypothetical protein
MDSSWAGAVGAGIGAFIGLLGGLATTALNSYLARPKPDRHRERAKEYLLSVFEADPKAWRDVGGLSNMVGIGFPEIWGLLLEVGARGSLNGGHLWGLAKTHPLDPSSPYYTPDPIDGPSSRPPN